MPPPAPIPAVIPAVKPPGIGKLHPKRMAFHVFTGVYLAWQLNQGAHAGSPDTSERHRQVYMAVFYALGFGGIFGETLRINTSVFNKFFFALFGACMREHEVQDRFSGMVFFLLGVAAAATVGSVPGVIGVLMLALGDPAAGAVGVGSQRMLRGRPLPRGLKFSNGKTVFGSLGCVAVCGVTLLRMLTIAEYPRSRPSLGALIAFSAAVACVTAIGEAFIPTPPLALPFKSFPMGLDDNLLLPVLGAATARALLRPLGLEGASLARHLIF